MPKPTVYAVMKAVIEIPVRASSSSETFEEMLVAAKHEAEDILRNRLPDDFRVIGDTEFLRAVIKDNVR